MKQTAAARITVSRFAATPWLRRPTRVWRNSKLTDKVGFAAVHIGGCVTEAIFYCCVLHIDGLFVTFDYDPAFRDGDKLMSIENRNWSGESLPRETFPPRLIERHEEDPEYRVKLKKRFAALPDFFDSHVIQVSSRVTDILGRFNIGNGHFYPMPLLWEDGAPLSVDYFTWNFGNIKQTLLPEQSEKLSENRLRSGTYYYPPMPGAGGHVAVTAAVLDGADVWIDPRVKKTFFITGRAVRALDEAGLSGPFQFCACKIIA